MDGHSSRMVIGASAVALALFLAACGDGSDDPPAAAATHHRSAVDDHRGAIDDGSHRSAIRAQDDRPGGGAGPRGRHDEGARRPRRRGDVADAAG